MNHTPDVFLNNKYLEFINYSPAHVNFNYHTELTAFKVQSEELDFLVQRLVFIKLDIERQFLQGGGHLFIPAAWPA